MMWGAVFLLICMLLNLAHVNVFKLVITLGVYAEMVGSLGVALLLFFFFGSMHLPNCFSILARGPHSSADGRFSGGACHCGLGLHWF